MVMWQINKIPDGLISTYYWIHSSLNNWSFTFIIGSLKKRNYSSSKPKINIINWKYKMSQCHPYYFVNKWFLGYCSVESSQSWPWSINNVVKLIMWQNIFLLLLSGQKSVTAGLKATEAIKLLKCVQMKCQSNQTVKCLPHEKKTPESQQMRSR